MGKEDLAVTGLIESKRSELRALCERYGVRRLALVGSALRDDFDSDHIEEQQKISFASRKGDVPVGAGE